MKPPMKPILIPPGYERLGRVFLAAIEHAAAGKGVDRHGTRADGAVIPYVEQQLARNARITGPAGPAFQVLKKTEEGLLLYARGDVSGARAEWLGAVNYLAEMAAAVMPEAFADDDGAVDEGDWQ